MSGFGATGAPVAPMIDGWTHLASGRQMDGNLESHNLPSISNLFAIG